MNFHQMSRREHRRRVVMKECEEMKKTDAVQRDLVMEGIVQDVGRSKSEERDGILLTNQQ